MSAVKVVVPAPVLVKGPVPLITPAIVPAVAEPIDTPPTPLVMVPVLVVLTLLSLELRLMFTPEMAELATTLPLVD